MITFNNLISIYKCFRFSRPFSYVLKTDLFARTPNWLDFNREHAMQIDHILLHAIFAFTRNYFELTKALRQLKSSSLELKGK